MSLRLIFNDGKTDTFSDVVFIDCLPQYFVVYFKKDDDIRSFVFARCLIRRFYLF